MTPLMYLQAAEYRLTSEQYQEFCSLVLALPPDEQPAWDEAVLEYTHEGTQITITDLPVTSRQGMN